MLEVGESGMVDLITWSSLRGESVRQEREGRRGKAKAGGEGRGRRGEGRRTREGGRCKRVEGRRKREDVRRNGWQEGLQCW